MKILFVNTLYSPNIVGGAERSVQFLAESLVQEGHEPIVITTIAGSQTKVDYLNKVKVYYIPIKNLYWQYHKDKSNEHPAVIKSIWHAIDIYNPWMAAEVARILDAEHPDVVHTNNIAGFSVSIWQLARNRKIPLVHTLRDYYLICPRKYIMFRNGQNCQNPCRDCKAYSLPKRHISNSVDAVIGISQFILDHHLKLNYFNQVSIQKVIYNSYQAAITSPDKSSCLRLGFLGRIDETKGFDMLLKTLEKLTNKNWELKVGSQVTEEEIKTYENRYPFPNVHYLGYVKPEAFFAQIDLLIAPSLWQEPLGRIVLEAYTHGVPVIGSNRGGIPEIIESGKTGFVFDPSQEESLAGAINKFLNNPKLAVEMGNNALKKSQEFTPTKILQAYLDVYQAVTHNACVK
jgi:glycosyltransferase involved in cell wall biosynthesis